MSFLEYKKVLESLRYKFSDVGTVHFSGIPGSDVLMFKNLILKNGKELCNYTTLSNSINIIFLLSATGSRAIISAAKNSPLRTIVAETSYLGISFDTTKNIALDQASNNFFVMEPDMQMLSYTSLQKLPSQDFTLSLAGVFTDRPAYEASSYYFYFEGLQTAQQIYPCYLRASDSKTNTLEFFNGDSVFFQVDPNTKFILVFRVWNNNALYSTTDIFYNGRMVASSTNRNNALSNGVAGRCCINKSNAFRWLMSSFSVYNKGLTDDECLALTNYIDVRDNYKSNIYTELESNPLLKKIGFDFVTTSPANLKKFLTLLTLDSSVISCKNMVENGQLPELRLLKDGTPKSLYNSTRGFIFLRNSSLISEELAPRELAWPFTLFLSFSISALPTVKTNFFSFLDSLNTTTSSLAINAGGLLYFRFDPVEEFSDNNLTLVLNKEYNLVVSISSNSTATIFLNDKMYTNMDFVVTANNFSKFKIHSANNLEINVSKFYLFDKALIYSDFYSMLSNV